MKKRALIQEQIDSLKKQYTENVLLIQKSNAQKSGNKATNQTQTTKTSSKSSNSQVPQEISTQTLKQKQSGVFLALGGGAFTEASTISFSPTPLVYDSAVVASGGALLLKLGAQKMWSNYVGGRVYLSEGLLGESFVSGNADLLLQIPLGGKVALGIYFGLGGGVLFSDRTYNAHYLVRNYSINLKRIGMVNFPYGISLVFGHSRFELGGLSVIGAYSDNGEQYNIKTDFGTVLNAITLSYQITF